MVEYSFDRPIAPAEILRLLRQTAWGADRTEADIARAIETAPVHVGAWSEARPVGFARVVTDGVYRAFVEDVVVDESQRGQGIGRGLLRELLDRLPGIELVALDCGDDLVPFYASLGFVRSGNVRMEAVRGRDRRAARPRPSVTRTAVPATTTRVVPLRARSCGPARRPRGAGGRG